MSSLKFPDLGVGVGLRPDYIQYFLDAAPAGIHWVEVISENYMDWREQEVSHPLSRLKRVRSHLPVGLHGVSLSIGSTDPLDMQYLKSLKKVVGEIEPAWISDHLCWTGVGGENLHDLLPLPYTQEAIQLITEKLDAVQNFLGRRILIENVSSYVEFSHSEMPEWEFIQEIIERADCGLLLDINNVYVSSVNHGFDPLTYLRHIPKERVGQIHLAGHTNRGSYLIDTHDEPVAPEVWALYKWVVDHIGLRSSMIERDDNMPTWDELRTEIAMIGRIREKANEVVIAQSLTAAI